MIRNPKFDGDATRVIFRKDGIKKECTRVIEVIEGKIYVVWEAIKSCFGKGFWINEQPWVNEDAWKNE